MILGLLAKLRKATIGLVMSVCPHETTGLPLVENFIKFDIWLSFEILFRKFKIQWNLPTITSTLHADRYTFFITSRSVLLRMRNVSDKSCTENQNTQFVFSNVFFENPALYEIMWKKYIVEWDRPQMTISRENSNFITICQQ